MGNIGSQSGQISQIPLTEEQQWAHSFPRTRPRLYEHTPHKVLPERDARQKLRSTNNGEILQSGGTLTGRHHLNKLTGQPEENLSLPPNSHEYDHEVEIRKSPIRTYLPNQRDPLHKSGYRYSQVLENRQNGFAHREQMKKFGSEPDLRYPTNKEDSKEKSRPKKKYKAPLPPNRQMIFDKNIDGDCNLGGENCSPIRRARLFKTRAETKRAYSSPVHNHKSMDYREKVDLSTKVNRKRQDVNNEVPIQPRQDKTLDIRPNRTTILEIKPQQNNFHDELKEATRKLKNKKIEDTRNYNGNGRNKKEAKEKLKTLDPNINKMEDVKKKIKQISLEQSKKISSPIDCARGEGSGKESSTPEQSPPRIILDNKDKQPKTFYFGMDGKAPDDEFANDIVENFASNLHPATRMALAHSSESDLSSELEMDESQDSRNGIDLQLRPILPKKQLEIPRFSPAAAWKLLSAVDGYPGESTVASEDGPVFIEDRIEKLSRPPPPTMQVRPRSSNDKSGDSGISGDAGPPGYDENTETPFNSRNNLQMEPQLDRAPVMSWTPQQDLGDDSSVEEGLNNENCTYQHAFSNKPHVFSLSLPRDNHLASYMGDVQVPSYTGLKKLKRSVSGVLSNLSNPNKKDLLQPNLVQEQSDNWFLSKSAPNSLNNGFNSLEVKTTQRPEEDIDQTLVPTAKYNSGRLMYLPEFDNNVDSRQARSRIKDDLKDRSRSADRSSHKYKLSVYSKSCENISIEPKSSSEPEDLQDTTTKFGSSQWNQVRKPKRFTFQSTVRQIERRKLAEKFSREAERKEKQRLRELEAMQKVEEEFQRKRAREKATIRQQLRLFSMDATTPYSSSPPNNDIKDEVPTRQEPDGAASSSPTSSSSLPLQTSPDIIKKYNKNKKISQSSHKNRAPSESSEENRAKAPGTPQILPEYRQSQRDYKEFRGNARQINEFSESHNRQTTVYPKVTCNMPKVNNINIKQNGPNYRKEFAHGVKSNRSTGSSYSEDSRNSPRMYHNKNAPITRF